MEENPISPHELPASRLESASLTPEQQQTIDTSLSKLRDMEFTYASNVNPVKSGPQYEQMQPILDQEIPKIQEIGHAAIPYLVESLKDPVLPENVKNKHIDDPNLARSDIGRLYTALFIDGFANSPDDVEPVLEALRLDTTNFAADPETPTVFLDTVQRLMFPVRELVEKGEVPLASSQLPHVADELIALYEATPADGVARSAKVNRKMLETLAVVGTPNAMEFVHAHIPKVIDDYSRDTFTKKVDTFNPDAWRQLTQFDFDPQLDMPYPIYRLKRPHLEDKDHQLLLEAAKKTVGIAESSEDAKQSLAETPEVPVEDPVMLEAKINVVQDKLQATTADQDDVVLPSRKALVPPAMEVPVSATSQPESAPKPGTTRRGFLKAFGAVTALAAAGLSPFTASAPGRDNEVKEASKRELPDATEPVEEQAPKSLPIPEQPGKEDALMSEPVSADEPVQGVPTERPEQPGADTAPMAERVEEPVHGTPAAMPEPLPADLVIEREPTLEQLLDGVETISVGEGSGTISEAAWTEAKQNAQWWKENYWYRPENMGAFTLSNYRVLKDAYEARLSEIPDAEQFPNGYPSEATILRWTDEAKNELMKIGMSSPTKEKISQFETNMNPTDIEDQLDSLDNLWHASWWVREGDTYRLPKLEDSQQILDTFRK